MGGAALLTHSQTRASSLQVATGGPGFYSSKGMCAAWRDTHAAGLHVVRIRSARVALEVASRQGLRWYPPQRAPGSAPPARGDNQRLARSLGPAKTRMASAASMAHLVLGIAHGRGQRACRACNWGEWALRCHRIKECYVGG